MLTGFSGSIFDCSAGYPFERLLDRNVVLELQEPVREVQQFVVETLLTWIFYYREVQGHRQRLRHVVLFAEAKTVFDRQREENSDVPHPPVTELLGRVREFGEALIVADHEPTKLSDSLKANTNAKLWMSLGSGKDTAEMRRTFGLEDEETDYTRTFEKGEALLTVADHDPAPVDLPDYQLEKSVTEEEIRREMRPELESLSWEERVRPDLFLSTVGADPEPAADADEPATGASGLHEVAEQLLVSVTEAPFLSISDRYDVIGVGSKKGTAAKQALLEQDLVHETEVWNGKRGRNPTFLELTDAGRTVLEEQGYDIAETGRRGIEHRYWQQQIKQYYEDDGFDVEIEHAVGQESIDVYAERGDEAVAIEVTRSAWHEVENVRKCLDYGVDQVRVAYLEDSVKDQVEAAVEEAFDDMLGRVAFVAISEFA